MIQNNSISTKYMNSDMDFIQQSILEDFGELLTIYTQDFSINGFYYQAGTPQNVQGWIIHISIKVSQIYDLLKIVVPVLVSEKVSFKIPINIHVCDNIVNGDYGRNRLGKAIVIYPADNNEADRISNLLITLTKDFQGPSIPTDQILSGVVYTRYGNHIPMLFADQAGKVDNYIYDSNGNLVLDEYHIPFKMSSWVKWPFVNFNPPKRKKRKIFLNRIYMPQLILKDDSKGQVIRAISFKNILNPKWCIIKQGRANLLSDVFGRDMIDRLAWQKKLHVLLVGVCRVPKIIDSFEYEKDSYLVMEYIEGKSLKELLKNIYKGRSWNDLSSNSKINVLRYLIKVVEIVEKLHSTGLVHRDITYTNFIVDKEGAVFLIDLELVYSIKESYPTPPFKLGTPGFASPEQLASKLPTFKEDIYGLGALMLWSFSHLSPAKFTSGNNCSIKKSLTFLLDRPQLEDLIISCLDADPNSRPELDEIKCTLKAYETFLFNNDNHIERSHPKSEDIKRLILHSLKTYTSSLMTSSDGIWHSYVSDISDPSSSDENSTLALQTGFINGSAGIIYLISAAKMQGLMIDNLYDILQRNRQIIEQQFLNLLPNVSAGLFNGSAGIAMALASGIKSGFWPMTDELTGQITNCFKVESPDLTLGDGISGQGIALLYCKHHIESSFYKETLARYTQILLQTQLEDGSWPLYFNNNKNKPQIRTGLAWGVAGIIYFLLQYLSHKKDKSIEQSVSKGVKWLIRQAKKDSEILQWSIATNNKNIGNGLWSGDIGIVLAFIKAHEVLNDPALESVIETILTSYPKEVVEDNFSLGYGLAGLGEVYLQAHEVFKEKGYANSVTWIANLFLHTSIQDENNCSKWIISKELIPSGSLHNGNGGILYFLINYYSKLKS